MTKKRKKKLQKKDQRFFRTLEQVVTKKQFRLRRTNKRFLDLGLWLAEKNRESQQ